MKLHGSWENVEKCKKKKKRKDFHLILIGELGLPPRIYNCLKRSNFPYTVPSYC
ncbi:hypothetical protein RHMOL_Rhmol11G0088500 [Rhododendron molle]|uniref:Uncharacterized protein n=1 Tax=Rhododendron molle TaxID=49168 RepID=A0ACC0LRN0_RHOML|nr:hypothetical protein RHMOL_Rhmol11G0088500 [Rhododendron molle]